MKFSAALLALTATVPSIAATSTRNVAESQDALDVSSGVHHRQLATEKYTYAGYGLSVDSFWVGEACEYSSSFSLFVSDGVDKYQSNGQPSETNSTYGWGGLEVWTDCDETSATHIYTYADIYNGAEASLSVGKKLNTASFTLENEIFAVVETCNKICDSDEYGEWCYYGECTTITDGNVPATISATLTATAEVSTFSSRGTYNSPGYISRYSSKGKERQATVDLSFILDGNQSSIPSDAFTYGSIREISSGELIKF